MKPCTQNPSPSRLRLDEAALCAWLGRAVPGDVLEYHRGFLVLDTAHPSLVPQARPLSEEERAELLKLGRRARWAEAKGKAHLLQRRHGSDDYSYLLVARRRRRKTITSSTQASREF